MKKTSLTLAMSLFVVVLLGQQSPAVLGVNISDPDSIRATLHVRGTTRVDTLPASSQPTHVLVLDQYDSVLHKLSFESLKSLFRENSDSFPDVVGTGFALVTTSGIPPHSFFRQKKDKFCRSSSFPAYEFSFEADSFRTQQRDATLDWNIGQANMKIIETAVSIGDHLYTMFMDDVTKVKRVYRYQRTNIQAGGQLMSFSGLSLGALGYPMMTSDGTYFYFSYNAGNTTNDNVIAKYAISGTTLIYISSITLGSVDYFNRSFLVDINGNYYGLSNSSVPYLRVFNSSGVFVYSRDMRASNLLNWSNNFYSCPNVSTSFYEKFNK